MIEKKVFKVTDTISRRISVPSYIPVENIQYFHIDDLQDQIDGITDNIENKYAIDYVFDQWQVMTTGAPFYFYWEIPLGTVEIISARVSFEVKTGTGTINFTISEDKGALYGNNYGPYTTDMRVIDILGDLTGEGIKIIKLTTSANVTLTARVFLKVKIDKKQTPEGEISEKPEVRTLVASSIESVSATLNKDIVSVGKGTYVDKVTGEIRPVTCTKRGFKYGLTMTDTWDTNETGNFVKGKYGISVTGLTQNTDYYFRAYAENQIGRSYGEYIKFTTTEFSNVLISCDYIANKIYIHSGITGDILDSFLITNTDFHGLAYDGTNLISADSVGPAEYGKIRIHSGTTSTVTDWFFSPDIKLFGLTYTGTNLISCDYNTHKIYIHSGITDSILDNFDSPSDYPSGLTYVGTNLISCDYFADEIYIHLGVTSTVSSSFASPATLPSGLTYDGTNLISCDYIANKIYIHSGVTSTVTDDFASEDGKPTGLAYVN